MQFLPSSGAPMAHGPAVEEVMARFQRDGFSCHSPDGTLLAPLLNSLMASGISYTLRFISGRGYLVERGAAPFNVRKEDTDDRSQGPRPQAAASADYAFVSGDSSGDLFDGQGTAAGAGSMAGQWRVLETFRQALMFPQ